ncbi:KamA family radical SAM protein [bacterium]|nr:KamA family radical SAM protein [bacterium]
MNVHSRVWRYEGMIETISHLRQYIPLSEEEAVLIERVGHQYPWRLTSYYASLIDTDDARCPLRRQAIPSAEELFKRYGDEDPLAEETHTPVPGVIRVYPDRIAVVVTNRCPMYCRHCLRKRFSRDSSADLTGERLKRVIGYVRGDSTIRDVLLTGGDPLMFSDGELDNLMGELSSIGHVELLRVGSRALCTWPERVTPDFADMLASHHPVWVSTQFNHPREITPEAIQAVETLLSRGIPINNQSVLLRGVNDSAAVMRELVQKLVRIRVRPYYLYQAQTLAGTEHFVTPIERGLDIIRSLRGWTTGFAVPQYVLDTPHGKIPLNPQYLRGRDGDYLVMESYSGAIWREYNPADGDTVHDCGNSCAEEEPAG